MDIRELRLFLHLSRTLHFGRTAGECHVSPSSLSRLVQKLEAECGAPLLERDNRTVRLTRAGLLLRAYAEEGLERWAALQEAIHLQSTRLQGRLSVFCSVTASYSVLPELFDVFRRTYPAVEIRLHTGDSELAIQRVVDEADDIAVAARPERIPQKLAFLPLVESPLVFIAPLTGCPVRGQLDEAREAGTEPPWSALPFISSETGLMKGRVDQWFRERGMRPRPYAQVGGNEAIVSMVSLGFGIGVVPRLVLENSPMGTKVEILETEPALEPFVIGLCCLRRKLTNPLVQSLWELAKAHGHTPELPRQ